MQTVSEASSPLSIFKGAFHPVAKVLIPQVLQFDNPDFARLCFNLLGRKHLVALVDGGKVKTLYDMEFEDGSNYIRYPNVCPKYQMWVDADLAVYRRKFKAFHEVMEVLYDLTVPGITPEDAHKLALNDEKLFWAWDGAGRPSGWLANPQQPK
jgi:hypothetical protein